MSGVVTRRGRWKTVCARGARQALLCGRSTSPLVVMASLIEPLVTAILLGAAGGYGLFVFRRFGALDGPQPRGSRLALLWLATLVSLAAFMAAFLGVGHWGGFIYCSPQFSPNAAWPCSAIARLLYGTGSLAIGLPLLALWVRFIRRTLKSQGHDD